MAEASYELSERAAEDIASIADYTIERFGLPQARRYRDGLAECFERIASNPTSGRRAEHLAAGLRRVDYGAHMIFYREADDPRVLIVRVLHQRMDPGIQFLG